MHPAVRRLIAQRPDPDRLWRYRRTLERPIEIEWHDPGSAGGVPWRLGPELARNGDLVEYVAEYTSDHEGTFACVLRVRPNTRDAGEGWCELGTVVSSFELYDFGADLVALRDGGARLSWPTAQWLHAAARIELDEFHHSEGKVHGAMRPGRIRLALFHRPYSGFDRKRDVLDFPPPPVLFVRATRQDGSDADRAAERALLAASVAALTTHPDPLIEHLLRDPQGQEPLRDLLLERAAPVEQLLIDRANAPELPPLPLAELATIDDELRALWHHTLRLDPMIDASDPAIFELGAGYLD